MLEAAYLAIFGLLVTILYLAIRRSFKATDSKGVNRVTTAYFICLIIWLLYLYYISYDGFIYDSALPPKFPIFVFLPVLIFMSYFFYSKRNSAIFESIPASWPIYFQSFRILMELIIFRTFIAGLIPIQATFQGYNFEIIFALTAPIIGYFTFVKPIISKRIVVIWNAIGILFLLIVVSIMVSAFFLPEVWGSNTALIDIRFTQLPFILLPAFMVPAAIFVHIFSIQQLLKLNPKTV